MTTLTEEVTELVARLQVHLAGLDRPVLVTSGAPAANEGQPGLYALDVVGLAFYGPKASSGANPWGDPAIFGGRDGWAMVPQIVSDGARRVIQVADWIGGTGTKPVTGQYVGSSGFVSTAAAAVDIRGAAGVDGADGADGADGDSAYQVAVANGFVGDEAAWLASLVGPTGPEGPAGSGAGDVLGPATHDAGLVPTWAGANNKTLGAGRAIGVASSTDLLDRAAGDGRYVRTVNGASPDSGGNVVVAGGGSDTGLALAFAEVIARLRGDIFVLENGWSDDFTGTSGVDLAASTSELYEASAKRFRGNFSAGTAKANDMTSNTAPSPNVAASGGNDSGREPFSVWDADLDFMWYGRLNQLDWVRRDFGAGNGFVLHSYDHRAANTLYKASGWTIEGSNDLSSWTVVDTVTGQAAVEDSSHVVDVFAGPFRYFRCSPTALRNGYHGISNLRLYPAVQDNLSLRSTAVRAALASPAKARLRVKASALSGSITPGTNLRAYATRTDGAAWNEVAALTYVGEFEGGRNYVGEVTFTGSAGTAMRWRVDTISAAADIAIDQVSLTWGD